jgi:hypothetical protein
MPELDPGTTFRGLPLTEEQDAAIKHYIKQKKQHGEPLDAPELSAMLKDMLEPPCDDENGSDWSTDGTRADAERAAASVDETMEDVGAREERNAAMESEAMKRPQT